MYKEVPIKRGIFCCLEKGLYDYVMLEEKPDVHIDLTSMLRGVKQHMWVRVTKIEKESFRWKCSVVKELPPAPELEKGFELNRKFEEWF